MKYIKSLCLVGAAALVLSSCNRQGYGCHYTQVKESNEKVTDLSYTVVPNDGLIEVE